VYKRQHLVDELLDCAGETQLWVVKTVQSWIMQVSERPEDSLERAPDMVTAPTFRDRGADDVVERVVDTVPRGVNEQTYRSAMIALVGVVAIAPAVALAVFFTQTIEVRLAILPLLGLVEIGAGWLLVIAAVVLSVLGLNTVPRRLTADHRGLTLTGSHAVKPVELPWEGLLWSRIEELGEHGSLLRLTLDPVLAPDTVERDEFGRAVIEVGHGLPAEDLAWLEEELEDRRRAATAPTSPIRQSRHPGALVT